MAAEFRQYDQHGFPVPPKFSDIRYAGDERKPALTQHNKRWVLLALLIGILALVFGPHLISSGREMLSRWFLDRAQQRMESGDMHGALKEISRAIRWNPSEARELLSEAYQTRSFALQRLGRFTEGAKDAVKAAQILPTPSSWNTSAYARALANIELPEALDDINKAITQTPAGRISSAAYLDTRGYIYHLLDRQEEALKDLDEAVEITSHYKNAILTDRFHREIERISALERLDHDLAVMHHHRGQIHEKLNHASQAQADLKRGADLGYDPAAGVF